MPTNHPTPPYEWRQPTFEPPEPPVDKPRWYKNPYIVVPCLVAAGVLGYSVSGPRSQDNSPNPVTPTPSATSENHPSTPATPTVTTTVTAKPTTPAQPLPSTGFPDISVLEGNVGFYAPSENDTAKGVLWGRAITKKDTVNFIPIACQDGVVTARLVIIQKDNSDPKKYKADEYPEIRPNPCDGDEIKESVRDTPFEYYSVLLGRIVVNGTIGR